MTATTYALLGVIVIQQIIHHFERKDLYNRIMSKNLSEYKRDSQEYHPLSAHKRVLSRWREKGRGDDE